MSNYSEGANWSNEATKIVNIWFDDLFEMCALYPIDEETGEMDEIDAGYFKALVCDSMDFDTINNGFLMAVAYKVLDQVNWEELAAFWAGVQAAELVQQKAA